MPECIECEGCVKEAGEVEYGGARGEGLMAGEEAFGNSCVCCWYEAYVKLAVG